MGKWGVPLAAPKSEDQGISKKQQQELIDGQVVSHLGKALAVEAADGSTIVCHTRRRLGMPAVGDRVLWEPCGDNQGRVIEILPRRSLLSRPGVKSKTRPVAANIDQLLIVFATEPVCDLLLIDQFLVVCELHGIGAHLLFNKIDLGGVQKIAALNKNLSVYARAKYPIHRVSAKTGEGIDRLRECLKDHTSMLVGQSGVGKSSISNILLPDKNLQTAALSSGSGRGTHTTTKSTLYHLPEGGDLIDSPGIAIFGLADISEQDLARGFREFQPYINRCQFKNCRHFNDKGCAVRPAMENGEIDQQRYQRYLKLFKKLLVG